MPPSPFFSRLTRLLLCVPAEEAGAEAETEEQEEEEEESMQQDEGEEEEEPEEGEDAMDGAADTETQVDETPPRAPKLSPVMNCVLR